MTSPIYLHRGRLQLLTLSGVSWRHFLGVSWTQPPQGLAGGLLQKDQSDPNKHSPWLLSSMRSLSSALAHLGKTREERDRLREERGD
jgi:hypothetical protein